MIKTLTLRLKKIIGIDIDIEAGQLTLTLRSIIIDIEFAKTLILKMTLTLIPEKH